MTAAHLQGPPRSTIADAIAAIVYHYAATASRGAWATGTTYAAGDTAAADGRVYVCFAPGTSDTGAGPAGMGSRRDANGVGWTPLVYVGERYLRQHGAPPRIVIVPGNGTMGDAAATPGPKRIGDGNVTQYAADVVAYLWAAESADDLVRYGAIEDALDRYGNVWRKIAPGRHAMRTVNPTITANIITFGEDRQVVVAYQRSVPRNAAIWAVPVTPISPPDPMRPNGDTGLVFTFEPTTVGDRP